MKFCLIVFTIFLTNQAHASNDFDDAKEVVNQITDDPYFQSHYDLPKVRNLLSKGIFDGKNRVEKYFNEKDKKNYRKTKEDLNLLEDASSYLLALKNIQAYEEEYSCFSGLDLKNKTTFNRQALPLSPHFSKIKKCHKDYLSNSYKSLHDIEKILNYYSEGPNYNKETNMRLTIATNSLESALFQTNLDEVSSKLDEMNLNQLSNVKLNEICPKENLFSEKLNTRLYEECKLLIKKTVKNLNSAKLGQDNKYGSINIKYFARNYSKTSLKLVQFNHIRNQIYLEQYDTYNTILKLDSDMLPKSLRPSKECRPDSLPSMQKEFDRYKKGMLFPQKESIYTHILSKPYTKISSSKSIENGLSLIDYNKSRRFSTLLNMPKGIGLTNAMLKHFSMLDNGSANNIKTPNVPNFHVLQKAWEEKKAAIKDRKSSLRNRLKLLKDFDNTDLNYVNPLDGMNTRITNSDRQNALKGTLEEIAEYYPDHLAQVLVQKPELTKIACEALENFGRNKKKDFFDLYQAVNNTASLAEALAYIYKKTSLTKALGGIGLVFIATSTIKHLNEREKVKKIQRSKIGITKNNLLYVHADPTLNPDPTELLSSLISVNSLAGGTIAMANTFQILNHEKEIKTQSTKPYNPDQNKDISRTIEKHFLTKESQATYKKNQIKKLKEKFPDFNVKTKEKEDLFNITKLDIKCDEEEERLKEKRGSIVTNFLKSEYSKNMPSKNSFSSFIRHVLNGGQ